MNYFLLTSIVMNINTPCFLRKKRASIVCRNYHMSFIDKFLENHELPKLEDIDFKRVSTEYENIMYFQIEKTSLKGMMYAVNIEEQDYELYIFEKNFASDRLITNVIEHIDEIVVIFDEKGVLQRMNSICDQILPFKRSEVLGKNIRQLVSDKKVENPIISQMIETKKNVYKEITYPNGKVISYTAIPIFGSSGRLKGGVLTGRDVSRIINLAKTSSLLNDDRVEYISNSKEIDKVKGIIERVAPSDAPIFIVGESGVGKEIIARTVLNQSLRRDKAFVAINCASIPAELIESELFGYEKGAFTGASKEGKVGLIEAANGGTLFLDEIGELPLQMQKKFLRVIQESSLTRIGGIKPRKIDVRYICATNKTGEELKNPKIFRQDLYYRLNVIPLIIPPLRERREDILPIANYYIEYFNNRYNRKIKLSAEAEDILWNNDWKGNIRELRNVMERLVILSAQENIYSDQIQRVLALGQVNNIPAESDSLKEKRMCHTCEFMNPSEEVDIDNKIIIDNIMNIDEAHRIVEQEILKRAVAKYGNITKAAEAVGINPSTVYRKIKSGYIEI
ncbi:sigma-54 interaction domain-containing protein [Peptostreptococcus equinus]|uniref:Sigma 54-interacting transcriptional regulator n=1 Tax=Peptostreptococcus equinus TaxID=3003601 RepID=A0ABY7JMT4_9FIRM|nr:sigma 54-interacting transcriptional regulator [Peptostreptococcus sp. CBA3647]WAW14679.1 sigma 54-interacting transcriptional regulator [Peptostreptococcus sp. CBA3647]